MGSVTKASFHRGRRGSSENIEGNSCIENYERRLSIISEASQFANIAVFRTDQSIYGYADEIFHWIIKVMQLDCLLWCYEILLQDTQ